MNIDTDTLRELFKKSLYLEVTENLSLRRSSRISQQPIQIKGPLSPQSKELLSLFSPTTQKRLERDFLEDDAKINKS